MATLLAEAFLLFILSLSILSASSFFLVSALKRISSAIGVSGFVIGSIILALSTSLPELCDVIISNLLGLPELGIGDIVGSNITNLCLVLGLVSLITISKVKDKVEKNTFWIALAASGLFALLALDGRISRIEGALFLALFCAYQYYIFKTGVARSRKKPKFKKFAWTYAAVPLAIFSIIVGAYLVVQTAGYLAYVAGIPVAFIGLTLVALGTSLPELSSGIAAAIKKGETLALGNLLGSNISNIFFILGTASIIKPLTFSFAHFKWAILIMLIATAAFVAYAQIRGKIDKKFGLFLILLYAIYIYLIFKSPI